MEFDKEFMEIVQVQKLLTREVTKEQQLLRLEHLRRLKDFCYRLRDTADAVEKAIFKAREDLRTFNKDGSENKSSTVGTNSG